MSLTPFQVEIVSPEKAALFSGAVVKLFATGIMGELEILANHAPLLTTLGPGPVWVEKADQQEYSLVIFGGILEVQPKCTTVLADAALRADEIDEDHALKVKEQAEKAIRDRQAGLDYAKANAELVAALAQLRIIRKIRGK